MKKIIFTFGFVLLFFHGFGQDNNQLLEEIIDIRVKTQHHLQKVEQKTGQILKRDILYCHELGERILKYKINSL